MEALLDDAGARINTVLQFTPGWVIGPIILLLAVLVAVVVHSVLHRLLIRLAANKNPFWHTLIRTIANPMRLIVIVAALALAVPAAPLSQAEAAVFHHILLLGFIAILIWVAQIALRTFMRLHLRRFDIESEYDVMARKHITQMRILQRVASTLILILGIGAMLTTFETVRQYGISLLASAGAAGIVVGLALQPLLKNIFAGIQLAITQPIRIGDALIIQGEYGNVEEITSTFVVITTWDRRRLIVPLNYFIEQPFENWTREDTALTGIVYLPVDYSVPVATLRAKAEELVRASPLWDQDVFAVQVTDLTERTMQVRILASANADNVYALRCDIREQMMVFLSENYPSALPRFRAEMETHAPRGNGAGEPHKPQQHDEMTGGRQ
ncbi:mechanosensitive ion channel family protein [Chelativorans sp. YIM 93263]|uniref:mechanosensitive ion channel family protein n=1 Tax=Chelativorans sp. YIM 93263 TaxID=2906648 RepID=UPI0023781D7C|nr:mechanosensitive ion channel domain-containing protein [Chelativorans sp. YIM 93263]